MAIGTLSTTSHGINLFTTRLLKHRIVAIAQIFAILLSFLVTSTAWAAGSLSLSWTASTTAGVTYKVYYDQNSVTTQSFNGTVPNISGTSQVVSNLTQGVNWCFIVTAVLNGVESAPSNMACGTIPLVTTTTTSTTTTKTTSTTTSTTKTTSTTRTTTTLTTTTKTSTTRTTTSTSTTKTSTTTSTTKTSTTVTSTTTTSTQPGTTTTVAQTTTTTSTSGSGPTTTLPPIQLHHIRHDLNGDGISDVIVTEKQRSTGTPLTHHIFQSDGTSKTLVYGVKGDALAAADYDGDGFADLVSVKATPGQTSAWTIRNSKTGVITEATLTQPHSIAIAGCDFDGDGLADIAGYSARTRGLVYKASSTGLANLVGLGTLSSKTKVKSVTCDDLDGDGHSDLVTLGVLTTKGAKGAKSKVVYPLQAFSSKGFELFKIELRRAVDGIFTGKIALDDTPVVGFFHRISDGKTISKLAFLVKQGTSFKRGLLRIAASTDFAFDTFLRTVAGSTSGQKKLYAGLLLYGTKNNLVRLDLSELAAKATLPGLGDDQGFAKAVLDQLNIKGGKLVPSVATVKTGR